MGAVMLCMTCQSSRAQTDVDGIMMGKSLFCGGVMASSASWNEYWEGTSLRTNENIGTIRTNMVGAMGNYGAGKNLNLLFSLPYVRTQATAGTLKGLRGLQDLTLVAKYRAVRKKTDKSSFSIFGIGGIGAPVDNYVKDLLPLSIGLGTTNLTLRGMLDYERRHVFVTLSGSYILRSNIDLDRKAYYTTRMVYSSEVSMPNVLYTNLRMGFRNKEVVAELVADQWLTQGGFDITKNNMPFPSNDMDQVRVGFNSKYEPDRWKGLSLTSAVYRTVAGRNMGRATSFQFGAFYILKFAPRGDRKKK